MGFLPYSTLLANRLALSARGQTRVIGAEGHPGDSRPPGVAEMDGAQGRRATAR
jgi:hypothetical protein